MRLIFSAKLIPMYFKSLLTTKHEQPKLWKFFTEEVPTFSVAFFRRSCLLSGFFTHIYFKKVCNESAITYSNIWEKYQDEVEATLERLFQIRLNDKIQACVCICPMYLRNIDKRSFLLPANADEMRITEIIIHELSHFYFFEAYKRILPISYSTWLISEQIVPYLIETHFKDIYSHNDSYVSNPSNETMKYISMWLNNSITFSQFIKILIAKGEYK